MGRSEADGEAMPQANGVPPANDREQASPEVSWRDDPAVQAWSRPGTSPRRPLPAGTLSAVSGMTIDEVAVVLVEGRSLVLPIPRPVALASGYILLDPDVDLLRAAGVIVESDLSPRPDEPATVEHAVEPVLEPLLETEQEPTEDAGVEVPLTEPEAGIGAGPEVERAEAEASGADDLAWPLVEQLDPEVPPGSMSIDDVPHADGGWTGAGDGDLSAWDADVDIDADPTATAPEPSVDEPIEWPTWPEADISEPAAPKGPTAPTLDLDGFLAEPDAADVSREADDVGSMTDPGAVWWPALQDDPVGGEAAAADPSAADLSAADLSVADLSVAPARGGDGPHHEVLDDELHIWAAPSTPADVSAPDLAMGDPFDLDLDPDLDPASVDAAEPAWPEEASTALAWPEEQLPDDAGIVWPPAPAAPLGMREGISGTRPSDLPPITSHDPVEPPTANLEVPIWADVLAAEGSSGSKGDGALPVPAGRAEPLFPFIDTEVALPLSGPAPVESDSSAPAVRTDASSRATVDPAFPLLPDRTGDEAFGWPSLESEWPTVTPQWDELDINPAAPSVPARPDQAEAWASAPAAADPDVEFPVYEPEQDPDFDFPVYEPEPEPDFEFPVYEPEPLPTTQLGTEPATDLVTEPEWSAAPPWLVEPTTSEATPADPRTAGTTTVGDPTLTEALVTAPGAAGETALATSAHRSEQATDEHEHEHMLHAGRISVRGLIRVLKSPAGPIRVLDGVDLDVAGGELVVISGPAASGASTLLDCLAGLEHADAGQVSVEGVELGRLSDADRAFHRSGFTGYVPQENELVEVFSAVENVAVPLLSGGWTAREARDEATRRLTELGLAGQVSSVPSQLSTSQRRCVLVARAVAGNPSVVLADHPTAHLDDEQATAVIESLLDARRRGGSIVVISRDPRLLAAADRRLMLRHGRLSLDVGS